MIVYVETIHIIFQIGCIASFNQSTYIFNEDDGPAQPVLVLSNPSSTDIVVEVLSDDNTAIGESY